MRLNVILNALKFFAFSLLPEFHLSFISIKATLQKGGFDHDKSLLCCLSGFQKWLIFFAVYDHEIKIQHQDEQRRKNGGRIQKQVKEHHI